MFTCTFYFNKNSQMHMKIIMQLLLLFGHVYIYLMFVIYHNYFIASITFLFLLCIFCILSFSNLFFHVNIAHFHFFPLYQDVQNYQIYKCPYIVHTKKRKEAPVHIRTQSGVFLPFILFFQRVCPSTMVMGIFMSWGTSFPSIISSSMSAAA